MHDKDKVLSKDPFNLHDILNKRKDSGDDLKYPPGFTPSVINLEEVNKKVKGATSNEVLERKKKGLGFWQEKLVLNLLALIESKEHGKQLLDSVKNGPFHFGTIPVPGTATTLIAIRDITMDDLTPKEKVREAMFTHRKAQINFYHIPSRPFYPPDVYSLVYIIMQRVL
ncbi:hypothetical protein Tco_0876781 [Tanacetum coccineum]|uniref:Uncharacterized protein n=1 Tax=Tanacetum coccineum TaxID=301880 RepID=A0ABQ5BT81_9ASTR